MCAGSSVALATRMSNARTLRSTPSTNVRHIGSQLHGNGNDQQNAAGLAKRLRAILWRCAHTGPHVPRDGPSLAPMPATLLISNPTFASFVILPRVKHSRSPPPKAHLSSTVVHGDTSPTVIPSVFSWHLFDPCAKSYFHFLNHCSFYF